MARPPDPAKRRALAHQALAVLREQGLGLSTTALAAALGIKRPTLLYYFPTKAAILESCLVDEMEALGTYVQSQLEHYDHPIDRLFINILAPHAYTRTREAEFLFLSQGLAMLAGEHASETVQRANQMFAGRRQWLREQVISGMRAGLIARCDAEAVMQVTRALSDGLFLQRVVEHADLGAAYQAAWKQFFAPLRRPTRRRMPAILEDPSISPSPRRRPPRSRKEKQHVELG